MWVELKEQITSMVRCCMKIKSTFFISYHKPEIWACQNEHHVHMAFVSTECPRQEEGREKDDGKFDTMSFPSLKLSSNCIK